MRIGIPTEVKNNEHRVAATPTLVTELVGRGHTVQVQAGAGVESGISDAEFAAAGAQLVTEAAEVWEQAELVLKVKEPITSEYGFLRQDLTLFTYLHLAADEPLTDALLASGCRAIAYETVRAADGSLPLLRPMSEIAGRLATIVGTYHCLQPLGGGGQLLPGVAGTPRGKVVVLGAGVAGQNAVALAVGLRAEVTVLDIDVAKLRQLEAQYPGQVTTLVSSAPTIAQAVTDADIIIGTVLVPGARAPQLVTDEMVTGLRPGTVLVDVAIDQGGCFAHSRPTTHSEPTYRVHDALYYCVANMPGAVPRTSTAALTNATLPYALQLADQGVVEAVRACPALAEGVNTWDGLLVSAPVAAAFGRPVSELPR